MSGRLKNYKQVSEKFKIDVIGGLVDIKFFCRDRIYTIVVLDSFSCDAINRDKVRFAHKSKFLVDANMLKGDSVHSLPTSDWLSDQNPGIYHIVRDD